MAAYRDALRVREFRALLAAFLISILGNVCAYLAISILVYARTHSPLLSALTMAVAFAPYLVGGTLLSGLVDRLRPKAVLVGFDLASACLVSVMLLPHLPVIAYFGLLFAIGMLAPIRSGVQQAIVSEVLPGDAYVAGRSAMRICSMSSQIVGYAVGGGLVAALGARGTLVADVASFVLSASLALTFVRPRAPRSTTSGNLLADSVHGMRAVWAEREVRWLILLGWLLPLVAVAPEALAVPAVAQAGHGSGLVGLWLALIPIGVVVGDVLVVVLVQPETRQRLVVPFGLGLSLTLLAYLAHPPLPVAFGLLVAGGLCSAYMPGLDQRMRAATPEGLMSRMFTVNQAGMMVIQGVGYAVAGAFGEVVSAEVGIGICGVIAVVGLGALWAIRPRNAAGAAPVVGAAPVEELVLAD